MDDFNICLNFIIFSTTICACLSPRVPSGVVGNIVLLVLALSSLWNIELTKDLNVTLSGLMLKGSVALIGIWLVLYFERQNMEMWKWFFKKD